MIAVIADDFTGAAEIAGIALQHGLRVELGITTAAPADTDVYILCTDTRSMNKADAINVAGESMRRIMALKPSLIYKKIDSVFRGYVLEEVKAEMKELGNDAAMIVAGNSLLGRTIKNGNYFINNIPIHQTDFANDPEFAIKDSSVINMLRADKNEVSVLNSNAELPVKGIVAGEVSSKEELITWATKAYSQRALVGSGDFFSAILDIKYKTITPVKQSPELPFIYVSGTAFAERNEFISGLLKNDPKNAAGVYLTPGMIATSNANDDLWMNRVRDILQKKQRLLIAIDNDIRKQYDVTALSLRTTMADVVKTIVENENVAELFIEGGSTAGAILSALSITKLSPMSEWQRGVVRMKAGNLYITVKPGSYPLPERVMNLFQ
jgi:uncharacterized protein YgbK (DUF1537 family)